MTQPRKHNPLRISALIGDLGALPLLSTFAINTKPCSCILFLQNSILEIECVISVIRTTFITDYFWYCYKCMYDAEMA